MANLLRAICIKAAILSALVPELWRLNELASVSKSGFDCDWCSNSLDFCSRSCSLRSRSCRVICRLGWDSLLTALRWTLISLNFLIFVFFWERFKALVEAVESSRLSLDPVRVAWESLRLACANRPDAWLAWVTALFLLMQPINTPFSCLECEILKYSSKC